MAEEVPARSAPRRGAGLDMTLWVALFLALYTLSPGPVIKLLGPNPPQSLSMFYAPLIYLDQHLPPVHAFYEWYFALWGVR